MAQAEYSQVRKGNVIVGEDGQLYTVVDPWQLAGNFELEAKKPQDRGSGTKPLPP